MFATLLEPDTNSGVGIAFTDRHGGVSQSALASLNLGRTDLDSLDHLRTNMARVRSAIDVPEVVVVHQVHGKAVHQPDAEQRSWAADAWLGDRITGQPSLPIADAVVSTRAGLALSVRVADCVPVLFADAASGVIGAAHAGRVGLLGGVLEATIAAMRAAGAREITAWIGPHICGQCYEVPAQMADEAARVLPQTRATTSWGTPAIDLGAGAAARMADLGVTSHRFERCTRTDDELFSRRADGPGAGRQLGLVWLAP